MGSLGATSAFFRVADHSPGVVGPRFPQGRIWTGKGRSQLGDYRSECQFQMPASIVEHEGRYHTYMDNFAVPSSFPMDEYRAFGLATRPLFPKTLSDEDLNDPLQRRTHFDWAWQAVRYRYRSATECSEEFQALLVNPSEMWQAGWGDEEFNYKLERCIYTFFMNGLSVFDSFAYALYFLGHAIQPAAFPDVAKLRNITRKATGTAFGGAFPQEPITQLLAGLSSDAKFGVIDELRNILGHRLSGRRSVRSSGTMKDGAFTTDFHEETWHIPGAAVSLTFDLEMLQRVLEDVAGLIKALTAATLQFAESHTPTTVVP